MSRDEPSCERLARSSGPGDPGCDEVQRAPVLAEVWTFLDGESTGETYAVLGQHLRACSSCLHQFALEGRMKNLIATRRGADIPPGRSRW